MDFTELPITGYLDRLSARPGESIVAHISVAAGTEYRARLKRVISADPHPKGPGRRYEDLSQVYDRTFAGRRQKIERGSYGRIEPAPVREARQQRTWTALVWTALPLADQAVIADEGADASAVLAIGAQGATLTISWRDGQASISCGAPLRPRQWYRIWASADPGSGRILAGQVALDDGKPLIAEGSVRLWLPEGGAILIAALNASVPEQHFSGKIQDPAILASQVEAWPEPRVLPRDMPGLVAAWDFALGIDTLQIHDVGPQACHGTLINLPSRAVVGAGWSGREHCWRHAPGDYAAIHFHADDLEDCRWEPDFTFTVPDALRSGSYVLELTCDAGEDWLPFYVRPPSNGPHARIAYLASTFTYQAYANFARGNADAAYLARVAEWSAYPYNPDHYPLYGRSTYNVHEDGAGVFFSSRLRPILTMRPGFMIFNEPRGSGTRHYVADSHLLAWLEDKGFAFDVVTDEDLDNDGAAALAPYRALITGSHPEYHTERMLDALTEYKCRGGRIAYLGGNGFYWRIARSPALPHVIEIRRAEGGVRAWAAEPGEYYHMLDGALGGMWRRNRRPPQALVGVGFAAQGLYEATYFRRTPASRDPKCAWIFAGIEDDIIGDYGLSAGGAAGFELDRTDASLGTPDGTVVLAHSENPPASMTLVFEDLLSPGRTMTGEPPGDLVRADMVYFGTPEGGEVFSAGSITFCGSLWRNGFEGPVSQLLYNVVKRFEGG
ncbi:MAG: N,N-dimethylformamidase beta subunit family domain-containing protein [Hyphomicrobiales bacterium]